MLKLHFSGTVHIGVVPATGQIIIRHGSETVEFQIPADGIEITTGIRGNIVLGPEWMGVKPKEEADTTKAFLTEVVHHPPRDGSQIILSSGMGVWSYRYQKPYDKRPVRFPGPNLQKR